MTHPPLPPLSLDVLAFSHVPGWKLRGRCANASADWSIFHPDGWGREHADEIREAKATCAACPVKATCLAWALETKDRHAILGGKTPEERAAIIRRKYHRDRYAAEKAAREAASA
jgi:WhiB family redox-sensing transcriptional regulator